MISRGCEPLTPHDIAEVVVFNASRRDNVVVADTLIFPNHQYVSSIFTAGSMLLLAIISVRAECLLEESPTAIRFTQNRGANSEIMNRAAATVMHRKS